MKQGLRILLINLAVFLFLAELISFCYIKIYNPNIRHFQRPPTYLEFTWKDQYMDLADPLGPNFIDSSYPWGTWHPRNGLHRQQKYECFDVTMSFNEEGARGRLPDRRESETVIFLGDSFVEGYGVRDEATIPAQYSELSHKAVLNLGCSGFGTTQMALVYENFAERYRHSRVIVILFLGNDFIENNPELTKLTYGLKRYRPYRTDFSDLSKIMYTGTPSASEATWETYRESQKKRVKLVRVGISSLFTDGEGSLLSKCYNLTYSSRFIYAMRWSDSLTELRYSEDDLRILEYDLKKIISTANMHGASVTVTNIPSVGILKKSRRDGETARRYLELESKVSDMVSRGAHRFISFYSHLMESGLDPDDLVFKYDMHLNELGDRKLSDFLFKNPR